MITLRLWRALTNPPATHPIFQRKVLLRREARRTLTWAGVLIGTILGLGQNAPTFLLLLMPLLLLVIGITYGIDCAIRVSSAIAREHENDTFNLLSLSPHGALGTSWVICTSSLYRNRDFDRLHTIMRATVIIAFCLLTFIVLLALLSRIEVFTRYPEPLLPTFTHFIDLTAVIGAVYIEYVQSTLLGCLVGIVVPTFTRGRLDAALMSLGVFLLLQFTGYFLAVLLGFSILPGLFDRMVFYGEYAEISLSILRVGLFFLIREGIIAIMWRATVRRLNGYSGEMELALETSRR